MIFEVRVIPRAKQNRIEKLPDNSLKIHVTAPREDNRANKAVMEVLSRYLGCKKNQISIVQGLHSQNKIIEIL